MTKGKAQTAQVHLAAGVLGGKVAPPAPLQLGQTVYIKGHTTDFQQPVESMQIEHATVQRGDPGQLIGLRVTDRVREHDVVYKVTPDA